MISLKEFLLEKLIVEEIKVHEDESGDIHHDHDIDGHKLRVTFRKRYVPQNNYMVHFKVNGENLKPSEYDRTSTPKTDPSTATSQKILQHVAASVHKFKQDHLPNGLKFFANEKKRSELYGKFAKHLSDRYKAKLTVDHGQDYESFPTYHLNFKQGSRPFDPD